MERRTDIPASLVPGSSRAAVATEWLARMTALAAVLLLFLTLEAIDRGKAVQASAQGIVGDFVAANDFFAERADFTAPKTARKQLQELRATLTALEAQTAQDVALLSATIPDVQALVSSGQGDVAVAGRLRGTSGTLAGYAGDLKDVAVGADRTVGAINQQLVVAIELVVLLNAELAEIERKLDAMPSSPN